eukprot:TRINITY_DN19932_c0_g1_i3.p1 TRINITY_DN19932_c0_g1~~TRINITY_DN19932_c0_g1_i3.p1  ORF type:complete len:134 (-),score=8.34 TRINITY_DN19932_c0_g1_i3:429-830(-)
MTSTTLGISWLEKAGSTTLYKLSPLKRSISCSTGPGQSWLRKVFFSSRLSQLSISLNTNLAQPDLHETRREYEDAFDFSAPVQMHTPSQCEKGAGALNLKSTLLEVSSQRSRLNSRRGTSCTKCKDVRKRTQQ